MANVMVGKVRLHLWTSRRLAEQEAVFWTRQQGKPWRVQSHEGLGWYITCEDGRTRDATGPTRLPAKDAALPIERAASQARAVRR